ncbi:hypothetical protein [Burkholderia vietnamiensis]|uniref:hypothetical protein n=1 Tax=Burkholderia vietnamiensis TaxID=60552 RepID=UPI002013081A|nr:hypothetical protein [Burkholderia vietnamiensis]
MPRIDATATLSQPTRDASRESLSDRYRVATGSLPDRRCAPTSRLEAAASRWADGCIRRPNARIAGVTDIATPIVDKTGAAIAILACPYLTHPDDAGAMPVEQVGVALYETARRIAATVDQRFMQSAVETPARRATCA